MLHSDGGLLVPRQRPRRVDHVGDFSAVEVDTDDAVKMVEVGGRLVRGDGGQLLLPDLAARVLVRRGVAEGEVDARLHGLVKGLDAIGGQEDYAAKVLQLVEKDCVKTCVSGRVLSRISPCICVLTRHHCVTAGLVVVSNLQQDICLIEQDNCFPDSSKAQKVS